MNAITSCLSDPVTPAGLAAGLRAYNELAARYEASAATTDAEWSALVDDGYAVVRRVERLPNTSEHLALRALAIGAATDNTEDLGNLDLRELSAHAESETGRLVRQVLACVIQNAAGVANRSKAANDALDLYTLLKEAIEAIPPGWNAKLPDEGGQNGGFIIDSLNDLQWQVAMFIIEHVPAPDLAFFERKVGLLRENREGFEMLEADWDSLRADVRRLVPAVAA